MEGMIAIWQRDVLKFFRDRARLFGSFVMPVLFLLIFGEGLSGTMESLVMSGVEGEENFQYVKFVFPGIVAMTILMTAVFSSLSIIQDKEFGYMKEIMVSPISRVYIALGKMLGASTVAFIQGVMMFLLIPFLGIRYDFINLIKVLPFMFLLACTLASVGLLIASLLKSTQGFQLIVQIIVMPMVFLSGALFPVSNMPGWMDIIVKLNPITYGVDIMKKVMIDVDSLSPLIREIMGLNLTIFQRPLSIMEEVLFMIIFTTVLILLATLSFRRANS
ncbi:ABC transporter permease [Aliibacillus thermotolerans]|uniref:Transport permease protein n=1 Tax=Aliibacillus thermotolerans TaxID=1834418 RepID=A0ABW0U7J5_9BACI|nr:ABC transporter permease [Aliibacillus thermotolerans]MDA3129354.1 ABC transporter permease subunit [Aliibacillus thermotolerans]